MKIVLASRNRHKIGELEALLSKYLGEVSVLSLDDVGIEGDIEENGTTFEENAFIKARAAAKSGHISIGDDSGLSVRALGGAPGIYSARFAGDHGNDAANNAKLLSELEGKSDRYGEFVCVIACVMPNGEEFCVRGSAAGEILFEPDGNGGFGYDPLFYSLEAKKSFAALTAEEKNAVSHRGKAIELFAKKLKEIISESEK